MRDALLFVFFTDFMLSLTLDTKDLNGSELYALRKYGKVKNGISRDILVSADQSLLQLHYIIQKLFGWGNGHLHKFELFPKDMEKLVGDSFAKYCYLCGYSNVIPVCVSQVQ